MVTVRILLDGKELARADVDPVDLAQNNARVTVRAPKPIGTGDEDQSRITAIAPDGRKYRLQIDRADWPPGDVSGFLYPIQPS